VDSRGYRARIQSEATERGYSQREYGNNVLVVGGRVDGENPQVTLIQGDDVQGKIVWLLVNGDHLQGTMV
jgi:hypothetical protein